MIRLHRMRRMIGAVAQGLVVLASVSAVAQNSPSAPVPGDGRPLQPGLSVENVEQGYQASRAGIQQGDVLLSWTRGDATGTLESPFDFIRLDLNQRPLGPVTLQGFRGEERRSWILGLTGWGVTTEPRFSQHDCGLPNRATQNSCKDNSHRGMSALELTSAVPWLRSWLLMRSARGLARKRWKDADVAYKQALSAASELPHDVRSFILIQWGDSAGWEHGDWAEARDCYLQAVEEAKKTGQENGNTAQLLWNLATAKEYLRDWEAARD